MRRDLRIPAYHACEGHLIVHGDLRIGAGSHVLGDVKVYGSVEVDPGAFVQGNLFADKAIRLTRDAARARGFTIEKR